MGIFDRLFRRRSSPTIEVSLSTRVPPVAPISQDAPPTWKNGQPYSEADKKWRGLQQSAMKNAKTRDWGLYTNDRLDLAIERRKEGKTKQALDGFLDVIYLDINGPENSGMGWNPSSPCATPAPAVVEWAWKEAEKLKMDVVSVKAQFLRVAAKRHESLGLPVAPEAAWPKLSDVLDTHIAAKLAYEAEKDAKRLQREAERDAKRAEREAAKALEKEQKKAARVTERLAKRGRSKGDDVSPTTNATGKANA